MKEMEIDIDLKKHMLWSKRAEKAIREDIEKRYPDRQEEIWRRAAAQYAEYLKDQPYIGGRRNRQASGVYDSIMILSYYASLPKRISNEELDEINNNAFLPVYERMDGKVNANNRLFLRIMHFAFSMVAKGVKKNEGKWPGNYHMEVKPYDKDEGITYYFHSCPIADFARRVGLEDVMPCICNADYPMLQQMKAGLIRHHTCSNGSCCDYHIVGNESEQLKEHPVYRDEEGYLRNK